MCKCVKYDSIQAKFMWECKIHPQKSMFHSLKYNKISHVDMISSSSWSNSGKRTDLVWFLPNSPTNLRTQLAWLPFFSIAHAHTHQQKKVYDMSATDFRIAFGFIFISTKYRLLLFWVTTMAYLKSMNSKLFTRFYGKLKFKKFSLCRERKSRSTLEVRRKEKRR